MEIDTTERTTLRLAIEELYRQTGLRLVIKAEEVREGNCLIDAVIEVEGYKALRYTAEVKKWVQHTGLGAMIQQLQQLPGKGMLVADYVNNRMADELRKLNVPFIDTAGNAYINETPLYIFIKGNRPAQLPGKKEQGKAFKPTGIKVIHALLMEPELVNATYRDIAKVAGVALGTVGWIFYDLKEAGFMVELQKKRQLQNKKKLVDRWVEAYLEKLRPKQLVGRFTTDEQDWWKHTDLTMYGAKWGGEVAAAKITDYLRPEKLTIYLPEKGGEGLFRDARFRKDEFGEIAVYRAFWKDRNGYMDDLADPLVVYADLLATADARNMETARIIYGEQLAQLVDEY